MSAIIKEILERRAKRAISPKPVDNDVLDRIFSAAGLAPSCMNTQPWRFLVLNTPASLEKGSETLTDGNYWAKEAPVLIVVLSKKDLGCNLSDHRNYALFGTGMAVMNLQLQAVAEGLYVHPMAGFDPVKLKEHFGIAEDWILITVIALGSSGPLEGLSDKHKTLENSVQQRKSIEEFVSFNSWKD